MTKKEIEELHKKIDKLQTTVDKLSQSLYKHIKFIDSTYDGLKNPISKRQGNGYVNERTG